MFHSFAGAGRAVLTPHLVKVGHDDEEDDEEDGGGRLEYPVVNLERLLSFILSDASATPLY